MIRRRKPLARNSKPIARSPLTRSSKPIPKRRSKPRRGPADIPVDEWRSPLYRGWIRETGLCVACGALLENPELVPGVRLDQLRPGYLPGYCDPAHTENGGRSMKGRDSSCAPLCGAGFIAGEPSLNHHAEYDAGRVRFEAKYGLDMKQAAAVRWSLWRDEGVV
jgi:hypothetical protein